MKTIILLTSTTLLFSACTKQESSETSKADPSAAVVKAKPYPLDICLVSGEELGSMGDPVVIEHEGQEIKFCCESCIPKFEKEPAKYLSKLENP